MLTYRNLGRLKQQKNARVVRIDIPDNNNFFVYENIIVGKSDYGWVAYDSICDHNGGTLSVDENGKTATCHLHKWTIDLSKGIYENGCRKRPLKVIEDSGKLEINVCNETFPTIIYDHLTSEKIRFFYNAHACVSLHVSDFKLITDPWLIGSCFATGWWHLQPPTLDAAERLMSADLIYISHNHPDHLHIPTLKKFVSSEQLFLVPNFESKSVENLLRRHGFNNLLIINFLEEIEIDTQSGPIKLVIVKSGDDRDDSSLIVFSKNQSVLFGVDTNMPNRWVLPKVDVLFTPFAGGASGFPVRILNFTDEQKRKIIRSNLSSIFRNHVVKLINSTKPKYVIPYAGYFREIERDDDVKNLNRKNSSLDLIDFVQSRFEGVSGLDPLKNPSFDLEAGNLVVRESSRSEPIFYFDENHVNAEIRDFHKETPELNDAVLSRLGLFFTESEFVDNLSVVFVPTLSSFEDSRKAFLFVNFSKHKREFRVEDFSTEKISEIENLARTEGNNLEVLYVREDSFRGVIFRGLPLEDLSIGFQAKMYRNPNVYNFRFWDYFTNRVLIDLNSID